MTLFTDEQIRAMHERAFTAFYETLRTYAAPGPARAARSPARPWSPPTGRCVR